ncbi:hypothetical protein [Thermostichus sp. MS-CIW-25]
MAIVYVSSNKLAEFLGISLEELREIEAYFDSIPDDEWELVEGKDYRVINKSSGLREYTQSGAYAILSFLRSRSEQGRKYSTDTSISTSIRNWFKEEYRKRQKALVDHRILENSSSLVRRQDQFWLSLQDVVTIFGTRTDYLKKALEIASKQSKLIKDVHYTRFGNDDTVYLSLRGIYELAKIMVEVLKQNHRKDWCRDVGERIEPQIQAIVKTIQDRQRQIERAKELARRRDKNLCGVTRKTASSLTVHHLYSEAHYPKIAANLSNLITIASEVHSHFHQWMGGFNEPCTIDDFIKYVLEYYPENKNLIIWLEQQKASLGPQLPIGKGREHVLYIPLQRVT